ncbi:MAG: hypothetical protein NT165_03040 [Candidatus Falkowbacteria bacterium]|nr:hypothetical protein [Candidatus Falkowbacteria bacterium]
MSTKKTEPHFVEKPLPSSAEVRSFERQMRSEERGEEINGRLSEIYRDERGHLVDVHKLEKKARQKAFITVFRWMFSLVFLALAAWAGLLIFSPTQKSGVELLISAPDRVKAGEEFSYYLTYRNNSGAPINSLKLELSYPGNFIFTSASAAPVSHNNYWTLPDLPAGAEMTFEVKGRIINQENSANVVWAKLSYQQSGFSSDLKKEVSASTMVDGLGFRAEIDYPSAGLAGAENSLLLRLSNFESPLINKFRIEFEVPQSVVIINPEVASSASWTLKKVDNYWQVEGINAIKIV